MRPQRHSVPRQTNLFKEGKTPPFLAYKSKDVSEKKNYAIRFVTRIVCFFYLKKND